VLFELAAQILEKIRKTAGASGMSGVFLLDPAGEPQKRKQIQPVDGVIPAQDVGDQRFCLLHAISERCFRHQTVHASIRRDHYILRDRASPSLILINR